MHPSAFEAPQPKTSPISANVLLVADPSTHRERFWRLLGESVTNVTAIAPPDFLGLVASSAVDHFDVIFCAMASRWVSGAHLFRATRRARSTACERFVFVGPCAPNAKEAAFLREWRRSFIHLPAERASLEAALLSGGGVKVEEPAEDRAEPGLPGEARLLSLVVRDGSRRHRVVEVSLQSRFPLRQAQ
jgi:hypothetical protein